MPVAAWCNPTHGQRLCLSHQSARLSALPPVYGDQGAVCIFPFVCLPRKPDHGARYVHALLVVTRRAPPLFFTVLLLLGIHGFMALSQLQASSVPGPVRQTHPTRST